MDSLFVLLLLLLLASLMAAIVLPIVSLVISVKTRRRLEALEAALAGRPVVVASAPPEPVRAPPPPPPEPVIQSPPPPPITPEPPPPPPPPRVSPRGKSLDAFELESLIGRRGVGWVAVVLILFATAFFLKYAFDNRWIGELGRVSIGIAFGIAMSLAGFRYNQRGWRVFSQILTAGGIVLFYLSTYAAFGYYHLVGQTTAFAFLAILIAEAGALAIVYNAPAIAIMALIGGLLTPVLLHSDRDQYRSFFTYLVVLDAGALALLKHWRGLSSIAYYGTQILFWTWYDENYHHQKRGAVLIFQTAIFLLFLLAHLARELLRREPPTLEDAMLLLANPFV